MTETRGQTQQHLVKIMISTESERPLTKRGVAVFRIVLNVAAHYRLMGTLVGVTGTPVGATEHPLELLANSPTMSIFHLPPPPPPPPPNCPHQYCGVEQTTKQR